MIDWGLTTSIKDLWQENLLQDYTLVVEDHELQVHKVVLAAVSKYFKAMFAEAYMESKMDRVEVKGFSAEIVFKLLEFIYTGEEDCIAEDVLEILQCSMYLQMPLVSQFCVQKLVENLNVQNCLEVLSAMIELTFPKEVIEVKNFIQRNWRAVMQKCNLDTLSTESVHVLMGCWQTCEWDMFCFVNNWICQDYENRLGLVNDLMSKVRFGLIILNDLLAIIKMDIYLNTAGPWQNLVVKAVKYHQLPIHLKVLDNSEQSTVKTPPLPVFFSDELAEGSTVNLFELGEENEWLKREHKGFKSSESSETICLEVNNLLIVCRSSGRNQEWQIFDPRTSTWSTMPNMERRKRNFALVYHNDILYTVGGQYIPDAPSHQMEQYSFLTNSWSSVHNLPCSLQCPATCALGGTIYISGGWLDDEFYVDGSDGVYCRDVSSDTSEWDKKASCLWKVGRHRMGALKRGGEEGLFIIDSQLTMQFYSPSLNQWSEITNTAKPDVNKHIWIHGGMSFLKGNSVFILNMYLHVFGENDDDEKRYVSWKLTIPENGGKITKLDLKEFPQLPNSAATFGAILAMAPQNVKP